MGRPRKRPIAQHWELHNGNPTLVLYRKTALSRTERCPYCTFTHLGSIRGGHMLDCCPELVTFRYIGNTLQEIKLTLDEITAADSVILKRENGYIIRNRPNARSARQTPNPKRSKTTLAKLSKQKRCRASSFIKSPAY